MGRGSILVVTALVAQLPRVDAAVYIDTPFSEKVFTTVPYFDFATTKWPYMKQSGDMLIGSVQILSGDDFDTIFTEYQTFDPDSTVPPESAVDKPEPDFYGRHPYVSKSPNFLFVEFRGTTYSSSLSNISHVAEWMSADFVVLLLSQETSWKDRFHFWWSHKLPGVSEMEAMNMPGSDDGNETGTGARCSFLAMGPTHGGKMIELLENFDSWNLQPSDYYIGIDDSSEMAGQTLAFRVGVYLVFTTAVFRWILYMDRQDPQLKDGEEGIKTYTGEELGMGEVQTTSTHECCICLECIDQGEQVRVLPCRHVFHHDCINGWFEHNQYSCPMCKMDLKKHLQERRLAREDIDLLESPPSKPSSSFLNYLRPWKRTISSVSHGQLIQDETNRGLGDLELSETAGVIV